ncbi:hypothetical protein [Deinococcus hopiensis]|uniref:hypothetical protein n=1 Tax=Deinococcus hopiensis TaxID=309885 RepID=UPI001483B311|nr:hypothetical protein [Deinococcus hopiensis]
MLLDLMMLKLDGFGVVERFREESAVPVTVLRAACPARAHKETCGLFQAGGQTCGTPSCFIC